MLLILLVCYRLCQNCDQFLDCLIYSRAYWVTPGLIAWNVDVGEGSCYLYASKIAGLSFSEDGIDGALILSLHLLPLSL